MAQSRCIERTLGLISITTLAIFASCIPFRASEAQHKSVKIGITLPLTGADAEDATRIKDGALMAIDDANAKGGIDGYKIDTAVYDNGTTTAGQYDPAQAATNAKQLISDPKVVANIGPQMSGSGKAMAPILSEADLATITPSSTNPDITDPSFAAQFRPRGKAIYFRTVTTDAYQGPAMADFFAHKLHVKTVYVLDDSGAYGVGLANAFTDEAKKDGIKVIGRDELDPKEADYTTILTKIDGLHPDALYFGGVAQAGVKLAKQAYDIVPKMIKGGGDGIQGGSFLTGAAFPAVEGWYASIAAPHMMDEPRLQSWIKRYEAKYNIVPNDYAVTAYDAGTVILDAVKQVAESGKPLNRQNVRDAIQVSDVKTLQGTISFDQDGDIKNHAVSIFEYQHNKAYPDTDVIHQLHYIGVAAPSVG